MVITDRLGGEADFFTEIYQGPRRRASGFEETQGSAIQTL